MNEILKQNGFIKTIDSNNNEFLLPFSILGGNPVISGVYLLFSQKNEIIYIGMSNDVFYRIGSHRKEGKIKFNCYAIMYENSFSRAARLENDLINRYKPRYNKDYSERIWFGKEKPKGWAEF